MKVSIELDLDKEDDLFKYEFLNAQEDWLHFLHFVMSEANDMNIGKFARTLMNNPNIDGLFDQFLMKEGFITVLTNEEK